MNERDLEMTGRLKEMEDLCDSLFEDFTRKATIAFNANKMKEYWYWMGRASEMTKIFSACREDADKLEEWSYEK